MTEEAASSAIFRFRIKDAEEVKICQVRFGKASDSDGYEYRISGDDPRTVEVNKAVQEFSLANPSANNGDVSPGLEERLTSFLQAKGYGVEAMPLSDITISAEFDSRSNRLVLRQSALHDDVEPEADVGRKIRRSLLEAFQQPARDTLSAMQERLASGDHVGAAERLAASNAKGDFKFGVTPELLKTALEVDANALQGELAQKFRQTRAALSAHFKDYLSAVIDTEYLKALPGVSLDDRIAYDNVLAISHRERGAPEAANRIWRRLITTPEQTSPGNRAWIARNLSISLPSSDPQALEFARIAADAFLEAGMTKEAVASLMDIASLLEHQSADAAVKEVDEALKLQPGGAPLRDDLRATLLHSRAQRLSVLGQHAQALTDAEAAVALRRGLAGAEEHLLSALHLAAQQAQALKRGGVAQSLLQEATKLESEVGSAYFMLSRKIMGLFEHFDVHEAKKVVAEARSSGHFNLWASATLASILNDPSLNGDDKVAQLELSDRELQQNGAGDADRLHVWLAIAEALAQDEPAVAIPWLSRVLDLEPLHGPAGNLLLHCLETNEKWAEAADVLKADIDRRGPQPVLVARYGHALLESGNLGRAITALTEVINALPADDETAKRARAWRERALDSGGVPEESPPPPSDKAVSLKELTDALAEFGKFISASKRKSLFRPKDKDFEWVEKPEAIAQDLAHTYLKAHFGNRLDAYSEIVAGAGRLDLLLVLYGGLRVVLELKMCGYRYSSAYAAGGEEQIRHYLDSQNTRIGCLMVFDARLNDYGKPLIVPAPDRADTISELLIDVRPRAPTRVRKPN